MWRTSRVVAFIAPPLACLFAGTTTAAAMDLPLSAAIERALGANRNLVSSRLVRDGEQYAVQGAVSEFDLKVVPTVAIGRIGDNAFSSQTSAANSSLGAQLRKKFDWGTVVSVGPSYNWSGDTSNTTLNVSVHQPLLNGFGRDVVLDGVRRADFTLASSERSYQQARVNLILETITVYHEGLRQQRLAEISEALSERLRRHGLIAQRKEKAGLAGPTDTFRAQIRLKDAEDSVNQARGALEIAKGRLRYLLALPADADILLHAPPRPPVDAERAEELALGRGAELQQLRSEHGEARRAAVVAANAALPDVFLNVGYGQAALSDPRLQSFVPTTRRQWSVFVQTSGDLNRTMEKRNYRRALLRVEAFEVALEDKSADIRRQVRQQLRALDDAGLRIGLREEQIRQAEGKLALAEVKFAHDMADNFELIEAEGDLQRARTELAAAETEYAIGAYSLKAMTGQLLPDSGDGGPVARR